MSRYTAQKEFSFATRDARNVIPDSGTSITVEFYSGSEWVTDGDSPITEPSQVFARGVSMRLTPDVGGFFIDEGEY